MEQKKKKKSSYGEKKLTFPWRISSIASGMEAKPSVGRSKLNSSLSTGKPLLIETASAATFQNVISSCYALIPTGL